MLDVQATALELYRERSSDHSDYKFLAVYQYVHTKPKFGALIEEADRKGNRKGNRETTKREGPTVSEGTDNLDKTISESSPLSRPIGQKAAKRARVAEGDKEKRRAEFLDLVQQRNGAIQEANDFKIATMDLSGMPPVLRELYSQKQKDLINRLTAEAGNGEGGQPSGSREKGKGKEITVDIQVDDSVNNESD